MVIPFHCAPSASDQLATERPLCGIRGPESLRGPPVIRAVRDLKDPASRNTFGDENVTEKDLSLRNLAAVSTCLRVYVSGLRFSQQLSELLAIQPYLTQDRHQGPYRDLLVIGDHNSPMGRVNMTQNNMAASLPIEFISDSLQRLHQLAPRNPRQIAHPATSTISSEIGGGIGSPCACRLSR